MTPLGIVYIGQRVMVLGRGVGQVAVSHMFGSPTRCRVRMADGSLVEAEKDQVFAPAAPRLVAVGGNRVSV